MANFNIQIDLGNAMMCEPADVADALRVLAARVDEWVMFNNGAIKDVNGNKCGAYGVSDD